MFSSSFISWFGVVVEIDTSPQNKKPKIWWTFTTPSKEAWGFAVHQLWGYMTVPRAHK